MLTVDLKKKLIEELLTNYDYVMNKLTFLTIRNPKQVPRTKKIGKYNNVFGRHFPGVVPFTAAGKLFML